MDVNWLIQQLKSGQTFTTQNEDGTTSVEINPPSKLHLNAARIIEKLATQLEHSKAVEQNLMMQLHNLYDEINKLQRNQPSNGTTQQDAN